jgi:6-phosphogluconolactonase
MGHIIVESDWVPAAAAWIRGRIEQALRERGVATVALCGGSSPAPVYAALARELDWRGVGLYFGDERCVPPDHGDSTYRLVMENLVNPVPGAKPNVFRLQGEARDLEAEARRYDDLLPESLDLAIQGMGPDGHTASLFPGGAALGERQRRVVHVADSPKPPRDRLTLTPPVLDAARDTVMLVRGADKAEAVARALGGPLDPNTCPAQLCRGGQWFLDPAAAAALDPETIE